MSLVEIQAEVAALSTEDRRKLAAYLTVLRMKETGEWDRLMQLGSNDRNGWITVDEAKRRLLRRADN